MLARGATLLALQATMATKSFEPGSKSISRFWDPGNREIVDIRDIGAVAQGNGFGTSVLWQGHLSFMCTPKTILPPGTKPQINLSPKSISLG